MFKETSTTKTKSNVLNLPNAALFVYGALATYALKCYTFLEEIVEIIKAVCECKDMSEDDTVLAVKRGRFSFIEQWGILTWIGVAVMILITGGFWIAFVAGWHSDDLLNPKYRCNQCDTEISQKQLRT